MDLKRRSNLERFFHEILSNLVNFQSWPKRAMKEVGSPVETFAEARSTAGAGSEGNISAGAGRWQAKDEGAGGFSVLAGDVSVHVVASGEEKVASRRRPTMLGASSSRADAEKLLSVQRRVPQN